MYAAALYPTANPLSLPGPMSTYVPGNLTLHFKEKTIRRLVFRGP